LATPPKNEILKIAIRPVNFKKIKPPKAIFCPIQ